MVGIHNIVRQRALPFKRLKVAKAMQSFVSHRLSGSEDLCSSLEQSEVGLTAAQKAVAKGAVAIK